MSLRCLLPPSTGDARAHARAEMLERVLEKVIGDRVRVSVAEDYSELSQTLTAGEAELAWAPAAVLAKLQAKRSAGLRVAYKVVRSGRSTYRSAIVVHRDSDALSVQALAGATPGWVDPLSLGGCLLAVDHLRKREIDLGPPRYFGSHPAALSALSHQETDVGAVSVTSALEEDVRAALELHAGLKGAARLRALAVTDPAPTDAFVLTEALTVQRAAELESLLFAGGAPRSLLVAMEVEGFERATAGEYAALARLIPDLD